ncbi:MAG: FxLYD domain-containing protein [Methanomicrobiales archaeon]
MKFNTRIAVPVLFLIALLLSAGCTNPAPVNQVSPVPIPTTSIATPAITPLVSQITAQGTIAPASPVPEETPIQVEAYVQRPFGFVKYQYNPAHKVRLLESHVETDPTGARMIVGTIKNIGAERIDLVTVTIMLFDADGNAIGSAIAAVNYLEPNRVWKFRTTPFTMSDFRSHQVAEIFTG